MTVRLNAPSKKIQNSLSYIHSSHAVFLTWTCWSWAMKLPPQNPVSYVQRPIFSKLNSSLEYPWYFVLLSLGNSSTYQSLDHLGKAISIHCGISINKCINSVYYTASSTKQTTRGAMATKARLPCTPSKICDRNIWPGFLTFIQKNMLVYYVEWSQHNFPPSVAQLQWLPAMRISSRSHPQPYGLSTW